VFVKYSDAVDHLTTASASVLLNGRQLRSRSKKTLF
jgi:hypothetical protein